MSENPDLILDVQIRNWVFFPIAVVTFLMGTILQHISMIVRKPPEPTQQKIRDGSNLARLNLLKVNYSLLPPDQFTARKMNFLDPEMGFFFQSRQAKNAVTALMNPEGIIQKTKDIMTSFLPQMRTLPTHPSLRPLPPPSPQKEEPFPEKQIQPTPKSSQTFTLSFSTILFQSLAHGFDTYSADLQSANYLFHSLTASEVCSKVVSR